MMRFNPHYRVRPSGRFTAWANEHPGFLTEEDEERVPAWVDDATFIVDRPPRDRYHGGYMLPSDDWDRTRDVPMRWQYSGTIIHSMLCPNPIPIVNVERTDVLPMSSVNLLHVEDGDDDIYRVWLRRWDPIFITQEINASMTHRIRTPPSQATGTVQTTAHTPTKPVVAIPKFVADALVRDAVAATATCPITMEPINPATAAVTSCFHVFDANAIAIWLANHHTCPTCKQPATTTPTTTE
jgi:hypothetical protein